LATVDLDVMMKAFDSDKKHDRDYYAVILPNAEGQIERRLLQRTDETRRALQQAAATMLTPTAEQTKLAA
jgi:3-dehydroquinate synthetase